MKKGKRVVKTSSCISSYDTDHIHHAAIDASSDKDKEANDSVGKAMVDGACMFVCLCIAKCVNPFTLLKHAQVPHLQSVPRNIAIGA